ncbi:MAG: hypothetical protein HZC55_26475 [Verrucomicrobia bacterium]|nr:hypothetical protein [Verrucomicrobiota bacterium]
MAPPTLKARYCLTRRGSRGDTFCCKDTKTGKRTSLGLNDENAAQQNVNAKNQAEQHPLLNLQLAKVYRRSSQTLRPACPRPHQQGGSPGPGKGGESNTAAA